MKAIICLHIGAAARNYKGKADKMHPKASLSREVSNEVRLRELNKEL